MSECDKPHRQHLLERLTADGGRYILMISNEEDVFDSFGTRVPNRFLTNDEHAALLDALRSSRAEPTGEPSRIPDLQPQERHARYWIDAAKESDDREEALMALHQAVCSWKNAAYAMADQRDAARSATLTPQWLVRAGGECYETWLCATREDVQRAFSEALYGDMATADADDIAKYMESLDDAEAWDGGHEIRWTFEDGSLEVIQLDARRADGTAEGSG